MGFLRRFHSVTQGFTNVWWSLGQETSLGPCLNLKFFGNKCTVFKKNVQHCWEFSMALNDLVPEALCPLITPLVGHFTTKCAAVIFVEPWMSKKKTCLNWETTATLVWPCVQRTQGKSCWRNPREGGSEVLLELKEGSVWWTSLKPNRVCKFYAGELDASHVYSRLNTWNYVFVQEQIKRGNWINWCTVV